MTTSTIVRVVVIETKKMNRKRTRKRHARGPAKVQPGCSAGAFYLIGLSSMPYGVFHSFLSIFPIGDSSRNLLICSTVHSGCVGSMYGAGICFVSTETLLVMCMLEYIAQIGES